MSDVIPAPAPAPAPAPLTPGKDTTEFYVAKIVAVLSTVGAALGIAIGVAEKAAVLLPSAPWLATGLTVAGIVSACLTSLVYTLSRHSLKKVAIENPVVPVGPGTVQDKAVSTLDAI
jgi:hypothetical protein